MLEESKIEWIGKGYVLNGYFFIGGFRETIFLKPSEEQEEELNNILKEVKNNNILPLAGMWIYGAFAVKYNLWIPAYTFQAPFKTLEDAKLSAKELIERFNNFSKKHTGTIMPICIAISDGELGINKKDPLMCDGSAYHISGRYVDNPNNCIQMIESKTQIRILDGETKIIL